MVSETEFEKFTEALDIIEELLDTIDSLPKPFQDKPWQAIVGWDTANWISEFLYNHRSDSVYAKSDDEEEFDEDDHDEIEFENYNTLQY